MTKSVLVLEDNGDLLELMTITIESLCDAKVVGVKSFRAISERKEQVLSCHLAILDINLGPDEPNGLDAYRWLRHNNFRNPIFFLTGHAASHPLVTEAAKLGDTKVLSKPLLSSELVKVVRGIR